MSKLTINLPNRPKGDMIFVPGLGEYANGALYEVPTLLKDEVFGDELPEGTKPSTQERLAPIGAIDVNAPKPPAESNNAPVKSKQGPALPDAEASDPDSREDDE